MIVGAPPISSGNKLDIETFCKYIPKLAGYARANTDTFESFAEVCRNQLNHTVWADIWEYALSLATAHYICITDPASNQAIGSDTVAGGVMSSRSIDKISYTYETDKTIKTHDAYLFWNQTGYGRALYSLSLTRGYIGMFIGV